MVLFSWEYGPGALILDFDEEGSPRLNVDEDTEMHSLEPDVEITEITEGQCAMCPIRQLLDVRMLQVIFRPDDRSRGRHTIQPIVFGLSECRIESLKIVLDPTLGEYKAQAIWRSALTRASSRPVDMVFSIMGLFGVTLEPGSFDDDDRLGATVALAQEIVRNGGKPSWLVMLPNLTPNPFLSSFPDFPIAREGGEVIVQGPQGEVPMENSFMEYGYSRITDNLPDAISMDDEGYLTIRCMMTPVAPLEHQGVQKFSHQVLIKGSDDQEWEVISSQEAGLGDSADAERQVYALVFGRCYDGILRSWKVEGSLVEQHAPGKFHRTSSFILWLAHGEELYKAVQDWGWGNFCIGGPLPLPHSVKPRQKKSMTGTSGATHDPSSSSYNIFIPDRYQTPSLIFLVISFSTVVYLLASRRRL